MTSPPLQRLCKRFAPLFQHFADAGYDLYLVGGSVRDALLGGRADHDLDFATNARPDDIIALLQSKGWRPITLGARFGTIGAHVHGDIIEITTYRAVERYDAMSRKPEVVFGNTIAEDLGRRDLSINAMAADAEGRVIDPYKGEEALHQGLLEVPGGGYENTVSILSEDPLRLLRIARFYARLGFVPTADTTRAASDTHERLRAISHERWKMELDKLLVAPHVPEALGWLADSGGLCVVFPWMEQVLRLGALARLQEHLRLASPDVAIRWAVLGAHLASAVLTGAPLAPDHGPDPQRAADLALEIAQRLRLSAREAKSLRRLCALPLRRSSLAALGTRPALRRLYRSLQEDTPHAFALLDSLLLMEGDEEPARRQLADAWEAFREASAQDQLTPDLPKGLGIAIQEAFGLAAGPKVGAMLRRVDEATLEGMLPLRPSVDEALGWLREHP